jgi:predicted small metal-binding protein
MAKTLSCRDAGVDCDFVARGNTEEEIFRQCAKHGKEAHGMNEIPEDLRVKMRGLIREEKVA